MPIATSFVNPLAGTGAYLTQDHADYNPGYGYHLGEDWSAGAGDTDIGVRVNSAANGTVVYAQNRGGGWGNVVIVQHTLSDGSIVSTLYGHLDQINVSVGQDVNVGARVGTIGDAFGIYDAHLHFEVYLGALTQPGAGYTSSPDPDPYSSGYVDPSYFIANFVPPNQSWPDLIASGLTISDATWTDGETISVGWNIVNQGSVDAVSSHSTLYLSTNSTITTSDTVLYTDTSTGTMSTGEVNPEGPGTLALNLAGFAPGTYYIGVIADSNGVVAESPTGESNNVSNVIQITIPAVTNAFTNGDDTVTMSAPGTARALDGNDRVTGSASTDYIYGDAGNDTLYGGSGNDVLYGGGGNDSLIGGSGNDRIDGGEGSDRAYFTGSIAATVNLALTTAQNTGHGTDTILNVEHISSGSGNDRLTGNALGNSLSAGNGNDMLYGGSGNDALYGGGGNDSLTGGSGRDTFVFNTTLSSGNIDRITDYSVVDDTIRLDDTVFVGLTTGTLAVSAFTANLTGTAADALDRVIYEMDTGRLYFDADGSGAGARVHFATLSSNLALTNADFSVF
jgi:Ca2+-binding RTX toxin-like protein